MNDLPGLPAGGFAMPMMRGFACPVTTPMMGAKDGPDQGIGCGWSNVNGVGVQFFISVHAEGGFAMIAQLDYARYRRFAENFAAIGRQSLLKGDLGEQGPHDPLAALEAAYSALKQISAQGMDMNLVCSIAESALPVVAQALGKDRP